MKDLVAKRYVKALVDGRDLNSVTLISEKLNEVSKAFKSDKFNSILASSDINEVEKTKFIYRSAGGGSRAGIECETCY